MIPGDIETTEKVEYEDLLKNYYEKMEIIEEQDKEIERLNNIINEFMEELKWQRKVSLSLNEAFAVSRIDTLLNRIKELKRVDQK